MKVWLCFCLVLSPYVVVCMPQTSGADILAAADNAQRYGEDDREKSETEDIVDELFSTGGATNDLFEPPKSTVDTESPLCSHYEEDGFFCVPYYQCSGLGEIIVDGGEGLIDIRSGIELFPIDSKCEGYLEVCCRHPDWSGQPVETPPPQPPKQEYVAKCGRHNLNGVGVRIQNDELEATTQFGEWPHMCALLEVIDTEMTDGTIKRKNNYVCGASLIEDNIVMTAAHCVNNMKGAVIKVRCGEWDTQKINEPAEHQDRIVVKVLSNPLFSSRNLSSNVALLLTDEPFVLSSHIDTICLPSYEEAQQGYDWENCIATGWGKDEFGAEGKYQVILKQVELNVVDHGSCQATLRTVKRLGRFFRLDKTAICAGGEAGVDTCKGDGGSPLVCPLKTNDLNGNTDDGYDFDERNSDDLFAEDPRTYVQAGIVGWGIGCGMEGIPGVYTDIATQRCYIDWATRCLRGDEYTDPIPECSDWAVETRKRLRYALNSYEYQLSLLKEPNPRYRVLLSRANNHRSALNHLVDDWRYCADDRQTMTYVEEEYDDQPDIEGFVRINAVDKRASTGAR